MGCGCSQNPVSSEGATALDLSHTTSFQCTFLNRCIRRLAQKLTFSVDQRYLTLHRDRTRSCFAVLGDKSSGKSSHLSIQKYVPAVSILFASKQTPQEWTASHDLQSVSASSSSGTQLARVLDQIAAGLHRSGLNHQAIWIRQRTIDISRELCRRDPERHRGKLAFYLHGLGDLLAGLGRSQVALRLLSEAVSMWRTHHGDGRKRTRLILALQRCGNVFKTAARVSVSALSRKTYAGAVAAKPIKKLLSSHQEMGVHIAGSLFKLATELHYAQQIQDACSADEKQLLIIRNLFLFDADGQKAALSASLHSASISLYAAGQRDSAWRDLEEAIKLRRELFQADPDAHRAALAEYINDLGISLREAQRSSDACAVQEEAVALQRELVEADPDSRRAAYAKYLNSLGMSLHQAQRFTNARVVEEEAVALQRQLVEADPNSDRPALAAYLYSLGSTLREVERLSEACVVVEEAVALQRELAETDPASRAHRASLAEYLYNFGNTLHDAQRSSDACAAKEEAISLKRELVEVDSDAHRAMLAEYLDGFGHSLHKTKRFVDACVATEEAVAMQRELAEADPVPHRAALADYLNSHVASLRSAQRYSDAYAVEVEAITLQRELTERIRTVSVPHLSDISTILEAFSIQGRASVMM